MSFHEVYPWLKAFHVAAALAFVGGVLGGAIFLRWAPLAGSSAARIARVVRRWDRAVTTPAMLLVWALGLALASSGQWFSAGWLQAKLVFVMLLSGLHGMQSGRLRLVGDGEQSGDLQITFPWSAALVIAGATAIALLAVVKPF